MEFAGEVRSADLLRLNVHLPLVVEFSDAPAMVNTALSVPGNLVPPEHVISWPVDCHTP
ncbi:MAG: hypothetical protein KGJ17_02885 [Gammaproteobacteria bacterium]|nr:hypothetical protein [Gammaproteobacteria bacterium]